MKIVDGKVVARIRCARCPHNGLAHIRVPEDTNDRLQAGDVVKGSFACVPDGWVVIDGLLHCRCCAQGWQRKAMMN